MKFRMVTEAHDYWAAKLKKLRDLNSPEVDKVLDVAIKTENRKELNIIRNSLHFPYSIESDLSDYIEHLKKVAERNAIDARKAEKTGKKDAIAAKIQKAFEHPLLNKALKSVGNKFFKAIYEPIAEEQIDNIKRWFTNDKFNVKDPPHPRYQYGSWHISDKGYEEHQEYLTIERLMLTHRYFDPADRQSKKLRPDWKEYIDKKTTEYANSIVDRWKNKMALKLGEVIERKGGAKVKSTTNDLRDHDLYFNFDDGSSFRVNTQQVWATSKLGKVFTRYPTTFHDVKFKDGKFMKIPSAEKMQDEFGISDFTISEKDK